MHAPHWRASVFPANLGPSLQTELLLIFPARCYKVFSLLHRASGPGSPVCIQHPSLICESPGPQGVLIGVIWGHFIFLLWFFYQSTLDIFLHFLSYLSSVSSVLWCFLSLTVTLSICNLNVIQGDCRQSVHLNWHLSLKGLLLLHYTFHLYKCSEWNYSRLSINWNSSNQHSEETGKKKSKKQYFK